MQHYVHGLREVIDATKDLVDEAARTSMRDRTAGPNEAQVVVNNATRVAAFDAAAEISALVARINEEAVSGIPAGDTDIVIRSRARRMTARSSRLFS